MDQEEGLKALASFRNSWTRFKKNLVYRIKNPGKDDFLMFFQHGNYQIRLRIMVGPRCGLFEACTIVDIRPKETEIDHLVASSCQRLEVIDSKTFLDLPPKVLEVKKSRNKHLLMATIAEWLERELLCFKEDPERCQAMIEGYHHIQEEMQTGSSIVCTGNALTRT